MSTKKANQTIENVNVGKNLSQTSSTSETNQRISSTNINGNLNQGINSQGEKLQAGKFKASGKIAVIGLVIVLIVISLVKIFLMK